MRRAMSVALLGGAMAVAGLRGPAWAQHPEPGMESEAPGPEEPGPEAPGPEGARRGEPPPDPAKEQKALDFIKENAPEMGRNLENARREHPEAFHQHMRHILPMYHDADTREVWARNVKSEAEVQRLTNILRHRQNSDSEKEKVKKDLEAALSVQFDAKLAQQETQVKKMEGEIARLKARIDKRRSLKDQIVKKRLGELSGDVESWDSW